MSTRDLDRPARPFPKPEKTRRANPSSAKRKIDKDATKRKLLADRVCRVCSKPAATGHHLIPKGGPHFGDDVEANIIPLCGSGTTGHHGLTENADAKTRVKIGRRLREDELRYVRDKLGPVAGLAFLERHYYREAW